jgi:hypothetical protein
LSLSFVGLTEANENGDNNDGGNANNSAAAASAVKLQHAVVRVSRHDESTEKVRYDNK